MPASRSALTPVLLLPLILLGMAASAPAQTKPAKLLKSLKSEVRAALKTHAAVIKGSSQAWEAQLAAREAALSLGYDPGVHLQLAQDISALRGELYAASREAVKRVANAAHKLLEQLGGGMGSELDGIYPKDFYAGTGGHLDRFRVTLGRRLERTRERALSRLKATARRLEKHGVSLSVWLRTRIPLPTVTWNELGLNQDKGEPLRLDTLTAMSDMTATGDGSIVASGTTGQHSSIAHDIHVSLKSPFVEVSAPAPTITEDERWVKQIKNLPEANWHVGVRPLDQEVVEQFQSIGVR